MQLGSMMKINEVLIKKLCNLARLKLTVDEQQVMSYQLTKIADYISIIKELDLNTTAPLLQSEGGQHQKSSKFLGEEMDKQIFERCVPELLNGLIRVPRTLEQEDNDE